MTNHAISKVFGTGTQKYFTPREPHIKICSDSYGRRRSRLDLTRTRFDVEGASSIFPRIFVIYQQDQTCLNPETHDLKRKQDFVIGHIIGEKNCSHKTETEERIYVC
jgi:hypothetical protein